ncbi:hypothetical protein QTL86_22260 [Cellulosilyticum sp. ST5]|uniref:hypothetical protein n=1 Tax=unclassified Cellulosilyticum TaxID=2643091 RepID=UPI0016813BCA|nr:hypothetical protein [Cellulosilyticum sp. WCF-2]
MELATDYRDQVWHTKKLEKVLEDILSTIENGSLTVVIQDEYAIQINVKNNYIYAGGE